MAHVLTARDLIVLLLDVPPGTPVYVFSEDNSQFEPLRVLPVCAEGKRYMADGSFQSAGWRVELSPGDRARKDFE